MSLWVRGYGVKFNYLLSNEWHISIYNCRCTSTRKKFIAVVVRWLDAATCKCCNLLSLAFMKIALDSFS